MSNFIVASLIASPALCLLALLIFYVCVGAFVNHRKLSHIKGPPLAGLSRLWLLKQSINKRVHIAQAEALKKYGADTSPYSPLEPYCAIS